MKKITALVGSTALIGAILFVLWNAPVHAQSMAGPVITVMNATLPVGHGNINCFYDTAASIFRCIDGSASTGAIYTYTPATDTLVQHSARMPGSSANGCARNSATGKVYCFGGGHPGLSAAIYEYDPPTDIITRKINLPFARYAPTCTEDSSAHIIYCMGGVNGHGSATNQIIAYNPTTNSLAVKNAKLPNGSYIRSCTEDIVSHKIYCFGGNTPTLLLNEILEYNPVADVLTTTTGLMPTAFNGLGCAQNTATQKILCLGGDTSPSNAYPAFGYHTTVFEYSIPDKTFTLVPSAMLPSPRFYWPKGCQEDPTTHFIYCFGGQKHPQLLTQIVRLEPGGPAQCGDGVNNDGDGAIDFLADFSCSNADDNDETNPKAQCQDGIDNDADGKVDFPLDPGCSSLQDNDEFNTIAVTLPQCSDGIDNDHDDKVDFFDPGCYPNNVFNPALYNPNDNDESNAAVLCRWVRTTGLWRRTCL